MSRKFFVSGLVFLLAGRALADPADLVPVRLVVRPQGPPSPSLRYRLLPAVSAQQPGDAGPLYKEAGAALVKMERDRDDLKVAQVLLAKWEDLKPDALPRARVRRLLEPYQELLRTVDRAARCEHCDWGLSERLRELGFAAPLPEIDPLRRFADLLALRARLALAEGRLDDAVHDIQTGFALARHAGEAPTLINALVGFAITQKMARPLADLVERDQAPNLYWALTDLPRPFIDLRLGLQGERLIAHASFPGLGAAADDLGFPPLSADKARALGQFLNGDFFSEERSTFFLVRALPPEVRRIAGRFSSGMLILDRHEAAERALIEAGRPRALVEKMPYLQVAVLHALLDYDRQLDQMTRYGALPFWEAFPHLHQLAELQKSTRASTSPDAPVLPLARFLVPAVDKMFLAQVRVDRRLAALRSVEALRLYAAAHDGKLPATLADLKDVPMPIDPVTGRLFEYHVAGDRAILYGSPWDPKESPGPQNALRFEIQLRR